MPQQSFTPNPQQLRLLIKLNNQLALLVVQHKECRGKKYKGSICGCGRDDN